MDGTLAFGLMLSFVDRFTGPMRGAAAALRDFGRDAAAVNGTPIAPRVTSPLQDFLSAPRGDPGDAMRKAAIDRIETQAASYLKLGGTAIAVGAAAGMAAGRIRAANRTALESYDAVAESLTYVRSIAPGTFGSPEKDAAAFEAAARRWQGTHRDNAKTYLDSSYLMLSAGFNSEQAIAGTERALRLALATKGKTADATSLLALTYNTLGNKSADSATELGRLADVLGKTQQYYQIADLNQLSQGMQYGIPTAIQYRQSVEEVAATIGQLNSLGLQGSMAGTAYSAMMRQMDKASTKLGFTLVKNAQGGYDLASSLEVLRTKYKGQMDLPKVRRAFQEAFGDEGLRAVSLLLDKTQDYRRGLDQVRQSMGAVEQAAVLIDQTHGEAMQRMQNSLNGLRDEYAKGLAMPQEAMANLATPAINQMTEWMAEKPGLAQAVGWGMFIGQGLLEGISKVAMTAGKVFLALFAWQQMKLMAMQKGWLSVLTNMGRFESVIRVVARGAWAPFKWLFGMIRMGLGGLVNGAVAVGTKIAAILTGAGAAALAGLAGAYVALSSVLGYKLFTDDKWRENWLSDAPATGASIGIGSMHGGAASMWGAVGKAFAASPQDATPPRTPEVRVEGPSTGDLAELFAQALVRAQQSTGRPAPERNVTVNATVNVQAADMDERERVLDVFQAMAMEH